MSAALSVGDVVIGTNYDHRLSRVLTVGRVTPGGMVSLTEYPEAKYAVRSYGPQGLYYLRGDNPRSRLPDRVRAATPDDDLDALRAAWQARVDAQAGLRARHERVQALRVRAERFQVATREGYGAHEPQAWPFTDEALSALEDALTGVGY